MAPTSSEGGRRSSEVNRQLADWNRATTRAELRDKAPAYLANGARLAVVVDVDADVVETYRPGSSEQTRAHQGRFTLDPELPGFALDLDAIRTA